MVRTSAHAREWEELAQVDPLWAIASTAQARHGRADPEAFYAAGRAKAEALLAQLDALGLPAAHGRALDFGCGAGRLTLPLADRFEEVVGVDVARSMLDLARARAGAREDVRLWLDERGDQSLLAGERFDLVYSGLVLQHLPSAASALACLERLCAAVAPGGALVVQLPTWLPLRARLHLNRHAYAALRRLGVPAAALQRARLHPMRMTAVPRARVDACLREAGLEPALVRERRARSLHSLTVYAARPA